MQIGVTSYSYSRLVKEGQMKQIDVVSKAKEMGFDYLEIATLAVPEGDTLKKFAKKLRKEADKVGIPIPIYTIGADFISGSNGDLKAEIKRVKEEVDIAEILGAKMMRHDTSYGRFPENWQGLKTFDAALPRLVEGCRAIADYAEKKGIRTMSENHGQFCQESLRIERIYNAVNHPNYGLLIDIGNFICADDDPAKATGRLAPYAIHCHVKDFHLKPGTEIYPGEGWNQSRSGNWWRGAIIGHGNVPVVQCLRTLINKGYDGTFTVEFEGMEDPIKGTRISQDNLRRFLELAKNWK